MLNSLFSTLCASEGCLDGGVLLFAFFPQRSQMWMRVTMLRLGKLWEGGLLVYLLIVHVIVLCLRQAARLNVKFVIHPNAKSTMCEYHFGFHVPGLLECARFRSSS